MCKERDISTNSHAPGQIWYLQDVYGTYTHPYLILSVRKPNTDNLIQTTAMTITSMNARQTYGVVPIILWNGDISYIYPFNLWPYELPEFSNCGNYRGVLNSDIMSPSDLMQMCIDIYMVSRGFYASIDEKQLIDQYTWYLRTFQTRYQGYSTHRVIDTGIDMSTVYDVGLFGVDLAKYQPAIEMTEPSQEEPQEELEDTTEEIPSIPPVSVTSPSASEVIKNVHEFEEKNNTSLLDQYGSGNNIPTKEWENLELVTFMRLYATKGGPTKLREILNIGKQTAIYNLKARVQTEIKRRGIIITS